jgi:hypothetical protein
MRCPRLVVLAATCGLVGAPVAARAQEPADTLSSAEFTVTSEPLEDRDTVETRRPVRYAPGGNPYLREVPEPGETPSRRGGYYASFGLGFGDEAIADLGAPAPYAPGRTRPTLTIGFGANIGSALRVGFDGFAWFNIAEDGALETVTAAMLGARVYPIPGTGLYLHAAGGVGRYGLDIYDGACGCSGSAVNDVGLAYALGAGFEVPVGRSLTLGPMVEMVRFNVDRPDGYRERVLNLGVTLTFDSHH